MRPAYGTTVRRWLWLLALASAHATGAEPLSLRVEPETVVVDRSFHLLFETDREVRADPDLSPLETDFEVVAQTRTRVQMRGRRDQPARTSWRIELMPSRAGTFTVPAIAFGTLHSPPLQITVHRDAAPGAAPEPADFVVAVEVDNPRPYTQQQVVLTVRVLHTTSMASSMLSEPSPEGVPVLVRALGGGQHLDRPVIHAGRRYKVYEQRYAVFPQTPGMLVVPPVRMEARTRERVRSRAGAISVVTRVVEARSPTLRLPVLAGAQGAPQPWLPARSLTLRETWQPGHGTRLSLGDTLTRRISVEARGLTAAQLPELALELPQGVTLYTGQPTLRDETDASGVTGTRVQTFTLAPTRPGSYDLPVVALAWWNSDSHRAERAVLAGRTLQVAASPGAGGEVSTTPGTTGATAADDALVGWRLASGVLGLAWVLTLWRWRAERDRSRPRTTGPARRQRAVARRAMANLDAACARHDARAARDALLGWAHAAWPQRPPADLSQLARGQDEAPAAALRELQRALYARAAPAWDGTRLRAQARHLRPPPSPREQPREGVLAPLYRSRRGGG